MDLLLAEDGLPIVCEVKIDSDQDAFYGLIQALAYAAELATPNQIERLKENYPNKFNDGIEPKDIGVLVLLVNSPNGNDKITTHTRGLCEKLTALEMFPLRNVRVVVVRGAAG